MVIEINFVNHAAELAEGIAHGVEIRVEDFGNLSFMARAELVGGVAEAVDVGENNGDEPVLPFDLRFAARVTAQAREQSGGQVRREGIQQHPQAQ